MKWVERIYTRVIGDANSIEIHETALMCKNGIKIFAEVTAGQFVYRQEPAVLFMIREITDHIRTENEPKKSSEMNPIAVLSGGVAHNYNNLLTAIMGTISQARAYTEKEVREIPDRVLPDAQ